MNRILQTSLSALAISVSFFLVSSMQVQAADNESIRNQDSEVWISGGADFFGYKEPQPAPYLGDSERDAIASVEGGVSYLGGNGENGELYEDWYFALEGGVAFGDAHYNGSYYYFPTVQLEGTTRETISNVDGKVGKAFAIGDYTMLTPYAELGFRYWNRNLGGGQVEDYKNFDVLGGLMLQVSPVENLVFTMYGAGGTTFNPQMNTGGDTFHLGDEDIYKVGGKIGLTVTEHTEVFTTFDYTHFRFGESSVVDGSYEPNSYTNEGIARVGVAYHFN